MVLGGKDRTKFRLEDKSVSCKTKSRNMQNPAGLPALLTLYQRIHYIALLLRKGQIRAFVYLHTSLVVSDFFSFLPWQCQINLGTLNIPR